MNNTTNKYQGRSLEDLKSSLRAVNHKIDDLNMEAATIVGILPLPADRQIWSSTEIDWNDPRLDNLRETFFNYVDTAYELEHVIGKLDAENNNTVCEWEVYNRIDKFLNENFNTFTEEVEFFKKNNLVRGLCSLRERVLENPDYLREVEL